MKNVQTYSKSEFATTEYTLKNKNGREFQSKVNISPLYNADNKLIALISISEEITEQKEKEQQLIQSEEKYKLIAENTSDGIFTADAEGKITYVSNSYLKQLGYPEQEELKRTPNEIYNLIHPDERDELFAKIYKTIDEHKTELIYTFRAKHKNGHYIWREDHAKFNYDKSGKLLFSTVICRDITERKIAEQHKIKQLIFSKALNEIAEIIIENENEDELLENVNQIIGKTLDLDRTLIYDVSYEGNYILGLCEWLKENHDNISVTKGQYSSLEMFKDGFDEIRRTQKFIESHHNAIDLL